MPDRIELEPKKARREPVGLPLHPGRGQVPAGLEPLDSPLIDATARDLAHNLAALRPESLHLLMDIGNRCNLRCIMCHFTFDSVFYQNATLMEPSTFERIARSIRPFTRTLTLSAAYEPTASPHFERILGIAGALRFPEISFLTNGNAISDSLAETIVASGVTEVCFSVHAARAATYEKILRGGRLERARANIEKIVRLRDARGSRFPRVQLNVALMRSNVAELPEIMDLAAAVGANSVAFRHVIVFEGLGMEAESLAGWDRRQANYCIRAGLERARELGVAIYNSPDFFDVAGFRPHSQVSIQPREAGADGPGGVPIGNIDSPEQDALVGDNLEIGGWALGPTGLTELFLAREATPDDPPGTAGDDGLIRLGPATFHNGTRADVAAAFPDRPLSYRAGWTYTLRGGDFPVGRHAIKAVAVDRDGSTAAVGTIIVHRTADARAAEPAIRCRKPFDSLYIDAHGLVYPYPDCHTDQPFGQALGQPFEEIWTGRRLIELREQMVAGCAPGMCRRCPLFINRDVDAAETFAAHGDFSTEERR